MGNVLRVWVRAGLHFQYDNEACIDLGSDVSEETTIGQFGEIGGGCDAI